MEDSTSSSSHFHHVLGLLCNKILSNSMESVAEEEEEGEEEDSMDSGCTTGCLGVFRKHDDEVRLFNPYAAGG